jgi:hypothetical protein
MNALKSNTHHTSTGDFASFGNEEQGRGISKSLCLTAVLDDISERLANTKHHLSGRGDARKIV